jgi:hypothetical protein
MIMIEPQRAESGYKADDAGRDDDDKLGAWPPGACFASGLAGAFSDFGYPPDLARRGAVKTERTPVPELRKPEECLVSSRSSPCLEAIAETCRAINIRSSSLIMIGCSQFRHCLAGHVGHPIRAKPPAMTTL